MASTVQQQIDDSQDGYINETFWHVYPLFLLVKAGMTDELRKTLDLRLDEYDFHGRVAGDQLRQAEYMAVSLVNTFMIAAIEGGVYPPEANWVADRALRALLRAKAPADFGPIIHEAAIGFSGKVREAARTDTGNPHVEVARSFIVTHITQDITVAGVAGHVGVSQSHLSRLFKRHTGKGIREYVIDERIAAAKVLLESGERSIPEIASLLRFCDQSYFTCSFRERTGTTPARYRKAHRL
ncbi:MAG: helix-turn-helix transcriptional regulator [Eggerthellaceae bacterium]|nr:helix-turn-helix transcriptional regulator [Eggerthellaceae bacterium]